MRVEDDAVPRNGVHLQGVVDAVRFGVKLHAAITLDHHILPSARTLDWEVRRFSRITQTGRERLRRRFVGLVAIVSLRVAPLLLFQPQQELNPRLDDVERDSRLAALLQFVNLGRGPLFAVVIVPVPLRLGAGVKRRLFGFLEIANDFGEASAVL